MSQLLRLLAFQSKLNNSPLPLNFAIINKLAGPVAQLVMRRIRIAEITGSIPVRSTNTQRVFPGPSYTGSILPWHGRERGSIPLGSTGRVI